MIVEGGYFQGKPCTITVHVREDDIQEFANVFTPLDHSTPAGIVLDWLLENGRDEDAERFRALFCEEVSSSCTG